MYNQPGPISIDIKLKRLCPDAASPAYATEAAAGVDLSAALPEPVALQPDERRRIPTGLAIQLPGRGWVGLLFPRSGLASRYGICLANGVGVIDPDYTGEIQVALWNAGDAPFVVHPGDRIAQLVFVPVAVARFVEVDALENTPRGARGFGSTGGFSGRG